MLHTRFAQTLNKLLFYVVNKQNPSLTAAYLLEYIDIHLEFSWIWGPNFGTLQDFYFKSATLINDFINEF